MSSNNCPDIEICDAKVGIEWYKLFCSKPKGCWRYRERHADPRSMTPKQWVKEVST